MSTQEISIVGTKKKMSFALSISIYFATFFSSIFCYRFAFSCKKKAYKNLALVLAICIPCVTASFRTSGADLKTYFEYFDTIKAINFKSGREPLWVVVNWLSPNKRLMLFFSAMIFLYFCSKSIRYFVEQSKSMAWSIVLLVFYSTFLNIMRQMIAVAIIAYYFKYLFRRKYLYYVAGVIIATLFHTSSIIMVAAPIILWVSNRLRHYDILILVMMFVLPFCVPIIFKLFEVLNLYVKYAHELTFKFEPQFILCMLPPVMLYYFTGGQKRHSKIINQLFNLYLISFPIQTMGFMAPYIDRLTYNFYFVLCLFVPMTIDEIKNVILKRRMIYLTISWFLIYYIGVFAIAGTATVYPYFDYNKRSLLYGR